MANRHLHTRGCLATGLFENRTFHWIYQLSHYGTSDILSVRQSSPRLRTTGCSLVRNPFPTRCEPPLQLSSQRNYRLRPRFCRYQSFWCCIALIYNTYFYRHIAQLKQSAPSQNIRCVIIPHLIFRFISVNQPFHTASALADGFTITMTDRPKYQLAHYVPVDIYRRKKLSSAA